MSSSAFDLDRIVQGSFVAAVDYHEIIASTNSRGIELAGQADFPHTRPLLILADQQLAGRGRGTNQWWSSRGSLTFSLLLNCGSTFIPHAKLPLVSLFTGLAVADAFDPLLPTSGLRLKWPNDVYWNGRKLCGILVETTSRQVGAIVIGVGVNVNNTVADAPSELQAIATSLSDVTGRAWDRTDVLIRILQSLAIRLETLNSEDQLPDIWRERCYLQGKTVAIEMGSRRVIGVCEGIDDLGALLLQTEVGIEHCFGGVVREIV